VEIWTVARNKVLLTALLEMKRRAELTVMTWLEGGKTVRMLKVKVEGEFEIGVRVPTNTVAYATITWN
jgi:hypothetical protein